MSVEPNAPSVTPSPDPPDAGTSTPPTAPPKPKQVRQTKLSQQTTAMTLIPGLDFAAVARGARRRPKKRVVIDDDLLNQVTAEFAKGFWPRDLPVLLGVPYRQWLKWLSRGSEDAADGNDTKEAELYLLVQRSRSHLENAYRRGMLIGARRGSKQGTQVFAWLLSRLSPTTYSDKAVAEVEAEILRLYKVVQETVSPETYGEIVTALENARNNAGGLSHVNSFT